MFMFFYVCIWWWPIPWAKTFANPWFKTWVIGSSVCDCRASASRTLDTGTGEFAQCKHHCGDIIVNCCIVAPSLCYDHAKRSASRWKKKHDLIPANPFLSSGMMCLSDWNYFHLEEDQKRWTREPLFYLQHALSQLCIGGRALTDPSNPTILHFCWIIAFHHQSSHRDSSSVMVTLFLWLVSIYLE